MTYIVLAGILTYTLFPIYQFLNQRTGRPSLSAGLSVVLALLVMILPTVYLVSEFVDQVSGAYNTLQTDSLTQVGDYLSSLTNGRVDFQEILDVRARPGAAIDRRDWRRTFWGRFPNCCSGCSSCSL